MSLRNRISALISPSGLLGGLVVLLRSCGYELLLRCLVPLHQAIRDRLKCANQVTLLGLGVHLHRHDPIYLELIVVAGCIELRPQIVDQIWVGDAFQLRRVVVGLERGQHLSELLTKSSTYVVSLPG